ncbi:RING/U-box protein [Thalictrum thalictroides]|uniref:RING/U-box protein n=1 Tax=Thalictrum thalictroides TaxID=46969 RepID=A0A7J6WRL3_THATH|nr:RING/U-box protein [Thalictrum thalictroides]
MSMVFEVRVKGPDDAKTIAVSIAAIGAALCDPQDNLILDIQKPLDGDWAPGHLQLKVELNALVENYNEVVIQRREDSNTCGSGEDIKFAFRLEIDSQITRSAESCCAMNLKETCSICLEDTDVGQMFVIDGCLHCYCQSRLRKHVEAKLRLGMVMVPRCPHEGCKTQLDIPIYKKLDIMNRRIKESSIHVTKRLYCPYPRCSELMSKSEVLPFNGSALSHSAI